jgi:DNA-binding response OmpR family regulator
MPTRVLVADDNTIDRRLTRRLLEVNGFDVVDVSNGVEAWQVMLSGDRPPIAVLDWNMPGFDGIELCRRVRTWEAVRGMYVILLTGRSGRDDLVQGLDAGADDYIQKPVTAAELIARVRVGLRVTTLQAGLAAHIRELEEASSRIRQLQGLIPMCCVCKRIRNDEDYWQQLESYLTQHSGVTVTHGYCPQCVADALAG